MIKLSDDEAYDFITEKMQGKCKVLDTIEADVMEFMTYKHDNYFTEDKSMFICVSYHDNYIIIAYAWADKSHQALRTMYKFAKELYKCYTIDKEIPIYYTGVSNLFHNHSIKISDDIYQLKAR